MKEGRRQEPEDHPDLRQGGWSQNKHDGDGAERQGE